MAVPDEMLKTVMKWFSYWVDAESSQWKKKATGQLVGYG